VLNNDENSSSSPSRGGKRNGSASNNNNFKKEKVGGGVDNNDDEEEDRDNVRLDGNFTKYLEMTKGNRDRLNEMKTEENFARGIVLHAQACLTRMKARNENSRSEARKKLHEKLEERKRAAENVLSHRRGVSGQSMVNDIAESAERRAKVWKLLRLPPQMTVPGNNNNNNNNSSQNQNQDGSLLSTNPNTSSSNVVEGMWETRLEVIEKNEKSAQHCRLFCVRATLALFSTSFPPSPEAIVLLSNFCDKILRPHSKLTPSQFLRWLKISADVINLEMKKKKQTSNQQQHQNQLPISSSPAEEEESTTMKEIELPWDCVFLQGWIRSELGVTSRAHVAWSDLPTQRSNGWKLDPALI
jgi:hypothetical protein